MKTNQISILSFSVFPGRNVHCHRPVMKMVVDIGKYGDLPTDKIPGFNERLLELIPGLRTNYCGVGYEGGFVDRLEEGTLLGHVLEHVILELQSMLGFDVRYGKTRVLEPPSVYTLIYEYKNEACALECSKTSVFILNRLLRKKEIRLDEFLVYLRQVSEEWELGPSTAAIVREAKNRAIPVTRVGNESLVRLGYGMQSRLVESTLTDATSCISADISSNKQLTKFLLSENKIPVPRGKVVYSEHMAQIVAAQIGFPVVLKPFDGNQGKGVHLNLTSGQEVKQAFKEAAKHSAGILVEKYITGQDYRILVVGDRVAAVAKRVPANVIGDGIHTIAQLVEEINRDPNRGIKHEKPLTRIRLDPAAVQVLKKQGYDPDFILQAGEKALLRTNGNISTGGTAIDCTDILHPDNTELAILAAKVLNIDIAGIDLVTEDISRSILETGGAIVEVNTAPGIRMHLYPSEGTPRNVAKDIVDLLFPDGAGQFPIVSVTGTNGKTTVVRLIQEGLMAAGYPTGMTSTGGTFVGHKCICPGDNSGPRSARALLANKSVRAAVLETARGGILREGLGYDLADVGVITNITEDHLGLDGIETLEDLVHVKSLVAEAIKEHGALVLNAVDPSTEQILNRVHRNLVLFSMDEQKFNRYEGLNFTRVFHREGKIFIDETELMDVCQIPITMGGLIACNIENALAACSALVALKIQPETIRTAFAQFTDNPGRFSLFSLGQVNILLDYGHNPAGYAQSIGVCRLLAEKKLIGIIGVPGDRSDALIREVGALCAAEFDALVIKEDLNLRTRRPGEVAHLLKQALLDNGFDPDHLNVQTSELEALKRAVEQAAPGDLIAVFYESFEPLQKWLLEQGATLEKASPKENKVLALPLRVV